MAATPQGLLTVVRTVLSSDVTTSVRIVVEARGAVTVADWLNAQWVGWTAAWGCKLNQPVGNDTVMGRVESFNYLRPLKFSNSN
jgi:hypothetical protein